MQNVLVVGGAGYIGSHTVRQLLEKRYRVFVIDDLSTGSKAAIPQGAEFRQIDVRNTVDLRSFFSLQKFDAVFHFAAKLSVPESFHKHFEYFDLNVTGTRNLLQMCEEFSIKHFIFSSTAAVYGSVSEAAVTEDYPLNPQNPYGLTKQMAEMLVLNQAQIQPGFKFQILRYFNVAGAEIDGSNGPRNLNSGQLIMNLCRSAEGDKKVKVYGTDYHTVDGTAVRDYIHVVDLADAHLQAYKNISGNHESGVWNCGYGRGYSVMQVIQAFEKANAIKFEVSLSDRRQGDPAEVTANNTRIVRQSQWRPKFDDLELICKSSYEWVKNALHQR